MLEHTALALKSAGVNSIIINLHHLAQQVREFVESRNGFGMQIEFSFEPQILGTGGGVKQARDFLDKAPYFFIHNADIYSDFDLKSLAQYHLRSKALATLATLPQVSDRPLMFDERGELIGWGGSDGKLSQTKNSSSSILRMFSGVQVVSPEIFEFMEEELAPFSTITTYLKCVAAGARVIEFCMHDNYWIDVGTQPKLLELTEYIEKSR